MNMNNDKPKKIILLEKLLRWMASLVLEKYNPRIVGITGSVGKTSSKEAIFAVLAGHFRVRKNEKNYNNEIGLPLTIIGAQAGGRSILAWLQVFLKWLWLVVFPVEYPEILILEMGTDRPGDIKYLTSFIHPEVAVMTDVSGSHLEYFKTIEGVAREKSALLKGLKKNGLAALNIDNPQILRIKNRLEKEDENKKIITFGFSEEADVRATDVLYNYSNSSEQAGDFSVGEIGEIRGLSFKLNHKGTSIPMRLNNVLADHSIYSALSGICVGMHLGVNLVEIGSGLANFATPCGRVSLIPGIKGALIIDDSYNSSPVSASAALSVLGKIKARRKIAVLGDMLELGGSDKEGHEEVAKKFLEIQGDIFFAVGKRMKFAQQLLKKRNFAEDRIFSFENPMEAGRKLQEIINEGDLILIKGSQGMRMEKVVEEIMAEPQKALELLCRQDKKWKEKPWEPV